VKVELESLSSANLHADAVLFNPNKNSISIKGADINIQMEEKTIAILNADYDIKVAGNSDFTVPLDVKIRVEDLNLNAISSVLSLLGNGGPELHFVGKIRVKAYGVPFSVKVDNKQKINIKL